MPYLPAAHVVAPRRHAHPAVHVPTNRSVVSPPMRIDVHGGSLPSSRVSRDEKASQATADGSGDGVSGTGR